MIKATPASPASIATSKGPAEEIGRRDRGRARPVPLRSVRRGANALLARWYAKSLRRRFRQGGRRARMKFAGIVNSLLWTLRTIADSFVTSLAINAHAPSPVGQGCNPVAPYSGTPLSTRHAIKRPSLRYRPERALVKITWAQLFNSYSSSSAERSPHNFSADYAAVFFPTSLKCRTCSANAAARLPSIAGCDRRPSHLRWACTVRS
jgi:hypothetical protein